MSSGRFAPLPFKRAIRFARAGSFAAIVLELSSVKDLTGAIRAFIDGWNDRAHPFIWTKTADQILAKAKRPAVINSGH